MRYCANCNIENVKRIMLSPDFDQSWIIYKDIKWYYNNTENFEILSTDPALNINRYAENLRSWINYRWTYENHPFSRKCMIICFPSQEMLEDCLRKESLEPKITNSVSIDGSNRSVYAIWIVTDAKWLHSGLKEAIGRICLLNHNEITAQKSLCWEQIGSAYLNSDVSILREEFKKLDTYSNYNSVDKLLALTMDEYVKKDMHTKHEIKLCAAALLLMRLKTPNMQYKTYAPNIQYKTYINNMSYDLRKNITPTLHLTWLR